MSKKYSSALEITTEEKIKIYFNKKFIYLISRLFENGTVNKTFSQTNFSKVILLLLFEANDRIAPFLKETTIEEFSTKEERESLNLYLFLFSCATIDKQKGILLNNSSDLIKERYCESYLLSKVLKINIFDHPECLTVAYHSNNIFTLISLCEIFKKEKKNLGEILFPMISESYKNIELLLENDDSYESCKKLMLHLLIAFCDKRYVRRFIESFPKIKNEKDISLFSIELAYESKNFKVLIYLKEQIPIVKKKINSVIRKITKKKIKKKHIGYHLEFLNCCTEGQEKKVFEMLKNDKADIQSFYYCGINEALRNCHIDLAVSLINNLEERKVVSTDEIIKTIIKNSSFYKYMSYDTVLEIAKFYIPN